MRGVLALLIVASAAFAFWGTPRAASQDEMARAVKAGDVRAIDTSAGRYGLEFALTAVRSDDVPAEVLWEDGSGRLHRTDLWSLSQGYTGTDGEPTDVPATIVATAESAGRTAPTVDAGVGPATWSAVPLWLLGIGALALLVRGPQPRRVTKWGMFWLLWIPLGVGLCWWLARDAPFSRAMNETASPEPRKKGLQPTGVRRNGGGLAFLVAWGASILVGMLAIVLLGLGASTNGKSTPTETWTLVKVAQQ